MAQIDFTLDAQQGPLPGGFHIDLEGDYIALVGANNAAKSSILQAIFKKFFNRANSRGKFDTCLILPERIFIETTTQTGSRTLEGYNLDLQSTVSGNANRSYNATNIGPQSSELPKLLLNHWNFVQQYHRINSYLQHFGLPQFILDGPQEIKFEEVQVSVQGSGLRSAFAILAALTDEHIKLLLIDEPEQSLEAGVQKLLRDLFYQVSSEHGKQIIVTTHSHLFLNRRDFASNYAVSKTNGQVSVNRVASMAELYDITFRMLGNSVEDLFLPYNYMVVEGMSDQIIIDTVKTLKGISTTRVKVISASGVDNVPNMLVAVCNTLTPLVVNDSPYNSRVVALVDKPRKTSDEHYKQLKKVLKDRLFTLDQHLLEEYLPEYLYDKCGRTKQVTLEELIGVKADYDRLSALKTEISNAIAGILTAEDIENIPLISDAIDKASK
jgi:AAA domain, putative AbiEii toxin, Type IV TA system